MKAHKYVIVGGGMAADSAVRGIREIDQSGAIAVINEEGHPPYDRPPLSKALWKGKSLESIWRHTPGARVALHVGRAVVAPDEYITGQFREIRGKAACSFTGGSTVTKSGVSDPGSRARGPDTAWVGCL